MFFRVIIRGKKQKKIYKIFLLHSGKKKKWRTHHFSVGVLLYLLLFIQLLCIELIFVSLPLCFVLSQYAPHQAFFKESYKKLFWYLILWAIIHGVWKPFKKSPFLVFLNPDTLFGSKLKSFIEFKKAQPKICQKGVTWHKCYLCWWELCQDFKCSSWSKPSSYSFSFFSDFSFSS